MEVHQSSQGHVVNEDILSLIVGAKTHGIIVLKHFVTLLLLLFVLWLTEVILVRAGERERERVSKRET